MTSPTHPSVNHTGRFTGLVLASVVLVCLIMIGFAGYMKYQLDRAQSTLTASDAASGDQDTFDRLRRSLGYSGFVGVAQNFAATHDATSLIEMKTNIKMADEIIARMPEKVPTEARRDLHAIITMFDNAMARAEKSTTDSTTTFTGADMAPLYAALPVMDARITSAAAVNRLAAQNELQFWAMLLTLVSWCSLIIASAMAVGIYLSLRDRNSAPLRGLVQSVKNMAHGDMRTSIWGMERPDMVGELARAVDLARYHFSQLPDMSLLSDQGPIRIRFEGKTKSMFEAMMQLITRDSEQVRQHAVGLADAVSKQQEAIALISSQVETVLHNILQRGQTGDAQVKQVVHDLMSNATALKNAQQHAADQLNRIVPFMQERAQGLSEITQITGKQVSQVLQSLIVTEHTLKASAEQSQEAITKLSGTADDLSGRLFGAVNLLQASGKVLSETTESTQSRLNEAIEKLNATILQPIASPPPTVDPDAGVALIAHEATLRLQDTIAAIETAQKTVQSSIEEQIRAAKVQFEWLTSHSDSVLHKAIETAADQLRMEQTKFDSGLQQISEKLAELGNRLEGQSSMPSPAVNADIPMTPQLTDISAQIKEVAITLAKLQLQSAIQTEIKQPTAPDDGNVILEIKSGFETTIRSLAQMREQLTNMVINVQSQTPMVTASIPAEIQEQMEQQTRVLTELVSTLAVLDEHMQQLKSEVKTARS